jgi:hypothetical protein
MRAMEDMGAFGDVHTRYREGMWENELEGRGAVSSHRFEGDAIVAGRQLAIARGTLHLIHARDGTVRERQSYRGDRGPWTWTRLTPSGTPERRPPTPA